MLTAVLRWAEARRGFWTLLFLISGATAGLRLLFLSFPPVRVFDEVYSPAFAWKLLHQEPYFDVHPLLTQLPHVFGLLLFGDTPLGWRFGPWLWGAFFILGLGALGTLLTGRRLVGVFAALLAALDVSFFVYGRTGLPDMFLLATFVWALALFFLSCRAEATAGRPACIARRSRAGRHLAALGAGALLGSLVATKWFGVGALVLVWAWIALGASGRRDHAVPRVHRALWPVYFLLVPVLVYLVWLLPLVGVPGLIRPTVGEEFFSTPACVFGRYSGPPLAPPATWAQRAKHWHCVVWNYHAHLDAQHPYASPWWSWPLLKHPVLFYLDASTTPARQISATGNPVLWWTGFATVWLTLLSLPLRWISDRGSPQAVGPPAPLPVSSGPGATSGHGSPPEGGESEERSAASPARWVGRAAVSRQGGAEGGPPSRDLLVDLWLLLGIFGFWLPWVFIQRVTFHYHYFLSFTLTILLLALWLTRLLDRPSLHPVVLAFLGLALGTFIYLYPTATATTAFWVR